MISDICSSENLIFSRSAIRAIRACVVGVLSFSCHSWKKNLVEAARALLISVLSTERCLPASFQSRSILSTCLRDSSPGAYNVFQKSKDRATVIFTDLPTAPWHRLYIRHRNYQILGDPDIFETPDALPLPYPSFHM